ncbi:MAG: iron-sulfur cluster repair di-iron protein [Holophagaceae bacterium]
MDVTARTPLGEIAAAFPPAMRVFEAHGLDYCCGGHRQLGEACEASGLAPAKVLAELEALRAARTGEERDWRQATATEVVEYLLATHHVFTRTELARLTPLMTKVAGVHGERHPELLAIHQCFQALAADLMPHLMKEEQVLFPYILALDGGRAAAGCFGTVANPIRAMEHEHDDVGELLHRIRDLSRDFALPEGACGSYQSLFMGLADLEADLHQHIHLENNVLFPKALSLEGAPA